MVSPENVISIIIAVITIFLTGRFLFSLHRSPDYKLEERQQLKKKIEKENRIKLKDSFVYPSGRVVLKSMTEEDIEKMRILRNKNRLFFIHSDEITKDAQRQWYGAYLLRENDYLFSVFYEEKWIGAVSIYDVDIEQSKAEFGRLLIDRAAAGVGGLGVDTTQAACQIAYKELGICTIVLEVYEDNEAAKCTYLKAGFVPVGTLCDHTGQKLIQMKFDCLSQAAK